MSINYNPFVLNTAHAAWTNAESSAAFRFLHTAKGALDDLFVKNPYDLTIGNAKSVFFAPNALAKLQKFAGAATIFGSSCYILMLYGANVYLAGRIVERLSGHATLAKLGKAVATAGEKVFFSGAVPLYAICYALPKKIIQNLPMAIEQVSEKVNQVINLVFKHVLAPFWQHVMRPICKFIAKTTQVIGKVLCKGIEALARKVAHIVEWTFKNVWMPLWNQTVKPFIHFICKNLEILADKIAHLATWTIKNLIQPLWTKVIEPTLILMGKVIEKVAESAAKLIQKIAPFCCAVVGKVGDCAAWIFQNVLAPCFNKLEMATVALSKILYNHLILPIGKCVISVVCKVAAIAQVIFNQCIAPCAQVIGNKIYGVIVVITETTRIAWQKTTGLFGI